MLKKIDIRLDALEKIREVNNTPVCSDVKFELEKMRQKAKLHCDTEIMNKMKECNTWKDCNKRRILFDERGEILDIYINIVKEDKDHNSGIRKFIFQ